MSPELTDGGTNFHRWWNRRPAGHAEVARRRRRSVERPGERESRVAVGAVEGRARDRVTDTETTFASI